MLSAVSALLFSGTNTIVGHPMDTIKTKMQAQTKYIEGRGMISTI